MLSFFNKIYKPIPASAVKMPARKEWFEDPSLFYRVRLVEAGWPANLKLMINRKFPKVNSQKEGMKSAKTLQLKHRIHGTKKALDLFFNIRRNSDGLPITFFAGRGYIRERRLWMKIDF